MDFSSVDFLAVALASVAAFVFGALYYMALAKPWLAAVGKSEEEAKASRKNPLPYLLSLAAEFVMATVLATFLGGAPIGLALKAALLTWVGFIATTVFVNNLYRGAPAQLSLIDAGHWLGVLLIQAAVISSF